MLEEAFPLNKRSCAFLDVDGTLLKGFIIQSFPRFLADNGFIDVTYPDRIDQIVSDYHSGRASYRAVAEAIPSLYASALKGRAVNDVKKSANRFMKAYLPEHLFHFTESLVRRVSEIVDVTITISGSPLEVVEELKVWGFDKIFGSIFEERLGVYTGGVLTNLILGEEKAKFAMKICKEMGIDLSKSLAFGDTDQDEPLLRMVGLPVAVNPNKKLQEICALQDWRRLEEDLSNLPRSKGV